ncbi:hypothetical protein [Glycomyces halotolerans]
MRRALTVAAAMVATSAGSTAVVAAPASASGHDLVPLVSFFNPSRGDHFTTTQSVWTCQYFRTCAADPSHEIVGLQGFVYDPADPQPANTVPLYHWWSSDRGDNMLTTDPRWSGDVGDRRSSGGEYVLFRIEGYVPTTWSAGTVRLRSHWNPTVADNAAIATWRYSDTVPSGWSQHRNEGYLLPPDDSSLQRCVDRSAHDHRDDPEWNAHGDQVNDWAAPLSLIDGDTLRVDADPDSVIRTDYWGHRESVFGYSWSHAGTDYPAPGEPPYALIGRVTSGSVYVLGRGWYEANEWFPVVGTENTGAPSPSPCLLYESRSGGGQRFQLSFNDPVLSDNGGFAPVRVTQWF